MQNIFLFCGDDLLPFYRHYSFCTVFWVSSFYLSVNIVVYQGPIHGHMYRKLRVLKLKGWLSDGKYCDYVFGSSTTFQRRKE